MSNTPAVDLIAAIVRGDVRDWPGPDGPAAAEGFLAAARRHGLHLVVAARLHDAGALGAWPPPVAAGLARERRAAVIVEELRRAELVATLDRLAGRGVETLLFKGTPLAYICYAEPWQRPRVDTALLVRDRDRAAAVAALEAAGYRRTPLVDGSRVMRQAEYRREDRAGVSHAVDLHWRVSNTALFAETLGFDELLAAARPVPALGGAARTLDPGHHLLVGCLHRVAHHGRTPWLVWDYDAHLLVSSLTPGAREAFARLAVERRVAALCAHEIARADGRFGTGAASLVEQLRPASPEPSADFLRPSRRRVGRLATDLRWQPRWRDRAALVWQHLFPSAAYMRAAHPGVSRAWLPVLYLRRILSGAVRWIRRDD
jgi:hypothetical protein